MTESEIQAAEERAQPRRETTREIARRVLRDFKFHPRDDAAELFATSLCYGNPWATAGIKRDLAELLRRAASGECDSPRIRRVERQPFRLEESVD